MVRGGSLRRAAAWFLVVAAGAYFATMYASARLDWVAMEAGRAPTALPPAPAARVAGAIHVHTRRSHDAIGTEAELARAARAAGLDFVFLADHRDAGSRPEEWERAARREEGVLLVRGQEIRVEGVGKVLVDRLDTAVVSWTGGAERFFARLERDSAFAVVAHPRGRPSDMWRPPGAPGMAAWEVFDFADVARRRLASPSVVYHLVALVGGELSGRAEHNWLRLYRDGFRDPGVAAFDSLWAGAGAAQVLAAGARTGVAGGKDAGVVAVTGEGAATATGAASPGAGMPGATRGSSGSAARPGPTAVGGLDMHPKVRLPGGRLFPAYESSLRTIVNHVALDAPLESDPAGAARALGAAIRRGRVFVSFGDTEAARGFRVGVVVPGGGAEARPGASRSPVAASRSAGSVAVPRPAGSSAVPGSAGSPVAASTPAGSSAASRPAGSHVPPGGVARMAAGLRLEAGFATDPGRVAYRVVRDGRGVGWWWGGGLVWPVDVPGAYRVEAYRYSARLGRLVWNLRPWIFTNPVRVRPASGGA